MAWGAGREESHHVSAAASHHDCLESHWNKVSCKDFLVSSTGGPAGGFWKLGVGGGTIHN